MFKKIRRLRDQIANMFSRFAFRSQFLSSVHYFFCDKSFRREQRAVLAGRTQFHADSKNPHGTSSLLRRNIHRIEKGLISRPRRSIFTMEYIEETVSVYKAAVLRHPTLDSVELEWAHDVLKQYFDDCSNHPSLTPLKRTIAALPVPRGSFTPDRNERRTPYARLCPESPVSYPSLLALAKQRRSIRWFQRTAVSRESILKAAAVAAQSPSASWPVVR